MSKLKSIGCMIFCGSQTIGNIEAGFIPDRILEISDQILENNALHFHKNYPNIPVILPSEWEKDEYLLNLKKENYDLFYGNCPCSGLSQINKNASADNKVNIHFYRTFDAIKKIEPKVFFIENAPTLINTGYPIILDMVKKFKEKYNFTVIRDKAGNHNVCMQRTRTFLIGWRKDIFKDSIPLLEMNLQPQMTVKEVLQDIYDIPEGSNELKNHTVLPYREYSTHDDLLYLVPQGSNCLNSFIDNWNSIKNKFSEQEVKGIEKSITKLASGGRLWNKTPARPYEDGIAPSMASVVQLIHPIHNRQFTIREYARLMGYPDTFEFFPNECKTETVQCIAQGVPVNFIKYIHSEIHEALDGNRKLLKEESKLLNFQHHIKKQHQLFSLEELEKLDKLDVIKKAPKLEK